MRMLMQVKFPLEPFNSAVRDGSAASKIQKILAELKPEAAYFTEHDGCRGGTMVVDLKDASEIPRVAEPFFLLFNASVQLRPVMTPEDLGRANLDALGKQWG
jgi:hypothetical protein